MSIKQLERFGHRWLALGTATAVLAALLATDIGFSAEHDDDAPVPEEKVEKVSKQADREDGAPKESWTSGMSPKKHVVEPMKADGDRETEAQAPQKGGEETDKDGEKAKSGDDDRMTPED